MEINAVAPVKSKKDLARQLGVSRQSLYYKPKLPEKDLQLKLEIEKVMQAHKRYGHKRIAIELGINKKRIRRVMKLFRLTPARKRRQFVKPSDLAQAPMTIPNLIKEMLVDAPNMAWVCDFTYLWFLGVFVYLATVEDIFTREIIGWTVSTKHDATLVCQAMRDALAKHQTPKISHSDQGSEYRSFQYRSLLLISGIKISMSKKASPWENSYQESFYSEFKLELGNPECYNTIGELIEAIALQIYYYNHNRIHTALKCSPVLFTEKYETLAEAGRIIKNKNNLIFQKIENQPSV